MYKRQSGSVFTVPFKFMLKTLTESPIRRFFGAFVFAGYIITFGLPADTEASPLSEDYRSLYVHEDGDYEILSDVISAYSLDDALQQVSGFGKDELEVIETSRFGLPEYQFAWVSNSDEGTFLSRASLVEDSDYYYALVFSVREGVGTAYEDCAEAVFASFGLHGDEMF